jgi:hypothetical protein
LGATSAGLQLPSGENKASSIVGIAAGVLSSTLAISGIRAQKGGTRLFEFNSNMLAEMFDRPTLGDSRYDQIVGSFLNEVAPTDEEGLTRKERLIQTWITLKRTDPPSTSAGKNKIDRVTSSAFRQIGSNHRRLGRSFGNVGRPKSEDLVSQT